jgi:hypothetical protein
VGIGQYVLLDADVRFERSAIWSMCVHRSTVSEVELTVFAVMNASRSDFA